MLLLLSPAKSLDFSPAPDAPEVTEPVLMDQVAILSKTTRGLTKPKLKALMGISDDLAALNRERFQAFSTAPEPDAVKPAILAFNGDVYRGLDAGSLERAALDWAQDHVRILSGLYGVLRPYDALQPYRLEMGTRLKTRRGETLYDFWGKHIAKALNADLGGDESPTVINLASKEYFSAVDRKALKARVITCDFKDIKDGKARTLGFFAKYARGLMARFAAETGAERPEDLKAFDREGYAFDAGLSTDNTWVFSRPQPPAKG
jgi:uncharacterized protein